MKLDRSVLDRRLKLMADEGIVFQTGVEVGVNVKASTLIEQNSAVLFTCGSTCPRDLPIPGKSPLLSLCLLGCSLYLL